MHEYNDDRMAGDGMTPFDYASWHALWMSITWLIWVGIGCTKIKEKVYPDHL